ncbi:protein NIM1-INTERACTING 2 [Andrographis paniculata]|uniref:protein NIM1-INTERACTING 2 n=1 Tax=Andrographis paniculata TaxID=175694 RepID=UPI0021E6F8B7|nr:protein NIM1-INTERACTING 2 [Andrographis paniculata]
MESENCRKRKGGDRSVKRRGGDDGAVKEQTAVPGDEEVDEFFAILKRVRVAVDYFRERDGGVRRSEPPSTATATSTATPWSPAFEQGDFEGGEKRGGGRSVPGTPKSGLDLNRQPDPNDDPK